MQYNKYYIFHESAYIFYFLFLAMNFLFMRPTEIRHYFYIPQSNF